MCRVSPRPTADLSFQAHPSQIYALAFAGDAANPVLLRCVGFIYVYTEGPFPDDQALSIN